MTDVAAATSPPPRRRPRRLLLKLAIGLLVAAAVVIAAVQAILWSDYPRQIAVKIAQNVTGLRVDIGKLTIGWTGHTTVDDLRVGLPLSDKPFLTVPHVDAHHTSLPMIVLTLGSVAIDAVTVDHPVLDVRQASDSTWNLQQVLAQLTTPSKNAAAGGQLQLPDVTLTNAEVHVTRADGKTITLNDIALTGRRDQALQWKFDAHAADLVTAAGDVSTAGRWPHRASVSVKPALLKTAQVIFGDVPAVAFLATDPGGAVAQLDWAGERTDGGLIGRLTIPPNTTHAAGASAGGVVNLTLAGGDVTVSPDGLTVDYPAVPSVTLAGGAATLSGRNLTLAGIRARVAGGTLRLAGSGDVFKQHGSIAASWEQIAFPPGVVHQGHLNLEAANIWPGRPWVKGDADVLATVAGGTFEARSAFVGQGPSWTDASYNIDLPLIRYGHESELRLENVSLVLHNTADAVELIGVRLPNQSSAALDAHAIYHFAGPDKQTGYLTAVGRGFHFGAQDDLGFNVNAWADGGTVTLQNAYANLGNEAWMNLAGQYVASQPEPIAMQLDLDSDPNLSLQLSDTLKVGGHVSGTMKVGGTLAPPHVTLDGKLTSQALKIPYVVVGDADLAVHGSLLGDRADIKTEHLRAFGGEGWFGAEFPLFSRDLHVWMGFDKIDAAQIGRAVGMQNVTGLASGDMDLHMPVGQIRGAYGRGRVDVVKPAAVPFIAANSVHIPVRIGDGYVRLTPTATQDKGGTAAVTLLGSLNAPTKLKLSVDLHEWLTQLPAEEFSVLSGGTIDLPQVDLAAKAVNGEIALDQQFFAHNDAIGNTSVRLHAGGRQVKLEKVTGQILGGTVYGSGSIDADDPTHGELWAGVADLSLARLQQIDPRIVGTAGAFTADLHTHAATGPNPLGPVQVDLNVTSQNATYKDIQIGDTHVTAYADRDRIALADEKDNKNRVALAGGTAHLWGRLAEVPAGGDGVERTSAFVSVHLDNLDTEQLNKMIDPDGKPVPGKLSGDITAFGNPVNVQRLSGQGALQITDSDLGNIGVFAVLYDAMHLGFGVGVPAGHGEVRFRLNAGRLEVTNLDYFNRGVFAKGSLVVDNVLDVKNSPFSGYVLGTFRPLKDIKLPFFGTIDSILDALQSSATTLKVEGSLKHITATPVSLRAIGGNLKNILIGQAQAK